MIVLSVILTILIAVILLKVDIGKIIEKIFKRKNTPMQTEEKERANVPQ
jgi:hypothetical protein